MKFVTSISLILALGSWDEKTHAFSPTHRNSSASSSAARSYNSAAKASLGTTDSYASVLENLKSAPDADAQKALIEALSTASDAANAAAATSAKLSSDLGAGIPSSSILAPEAVAAAQVKIAILESNAASFVDPANMQKSLLDALDASISAAEHAAASTSTLTYNLMHFESVLSKSMNAFHFSLIPPEAAEVAQAKLALLIHNLTGITYDDTIVRSMLAEMDRKLDLLPQGTASTMLWYATLAFVIGYSQRVAGVETYKEQIRLKLAEGSYDIDKLARDLGLSTDTASTINNEVDRILEDSKPWIQKEVEVEEETGPVSVMSAVAGSEETSAQADPINPLEHTSDTGKILDEGRAEELLMTRGEGSPVEMIEFSVKEEPKVNVVAKSRPVKVMKPKPKGPPASPLARLLADELAIDLKNVGKGSGKNGKILIDDVRKFQARLESARKSISATGAYFATVNA